MRMKKADEFDRYKKNVKAILGALKGVSNTALFIKPRLNLLESYFEMIEGRKTHSQATLGHARRYSISQGNKLMLAWIIQNERVIKA